MRPLLLTLLSAFFVFLLIGGCAQRQSANAPYVAPSQNTSPEKTTVVKETETAKPQGATPTLTVYHQQVRDEVIVEGVTFDKPGFIAVHEVKPDGNFGAVLSNGDLLQAGTRTQLKVPVPLDYPGEKLNIMLHYDTDNNGVYEFGKKQGVDTPVILDNAIVMVTIKAPHAVTEAKMAPNEPSTFSVAIQDFVFKSDTVTIKAGDTVRWTQNDGASHTATSVSGPETFDSGVLRTGQSFTKTFTKPGTYQYRCDLHPSMRGTIIVT